MLLFYLLFIAKEEEKFVMKKLKFTAVISIAIILQILFLHAVYAQSHYPVAINYQPTQVRISQLKIKTGTENNQTVTMLSGRIKRRSYRRA